MGKKVTILKRIVGTSGLPVAMFLVMFIAAQATGKTHFGTAPMWKPLLVDVAMSITTALAIGLQFKSGRFDFSGGAIMLLTAILAGNLARVNESNQLLFVGLCLGISLVLSLLVAGIYIYGRNPIVIATMGMALLYESITAMVYGGGGVTLISDIKLKAFSTYPMVFLPLAGGILVYVWFNYFTVAGKQSVLLANNQQAAVHIGIKEKWNVLLSYCFSGLIFGFATMMFASKSLHRGAFSSLVTVGQLFSNILPVFIGLMIARYSGDILGIVVGSLTLTIMSYGLTTLFTAETGVAISTIFTSLFIFGINVVSAQGRNWAVAIRKLFSTRQQRSAVE